MYINDASPSNSGRLSECNMAIKFNPLHRQKSNCSIQLLRLFDKVHIYRVKVRHNEIVIIIIDYYGIIKNKNSQR